VVSDLNEPTGAAEDVEALGFDRVRLGMLDLQLRRLITHGKHAAVACDVIRHDRLAHRARFGRQEVESNEPLRADAIFRMASMTKPVAGGADAAVRSRFLAAL
jgi:CubicO group peptidase (beta-lactamase class C family)